MWSATAEAEEFDEAVKWFQGRVPVTTLTLAGMSDQARQRAFFITGVAQLDIVTEVHASILEAIKKGTPFEEWQASISDKLTKSWGAKRSAQVETIYRNATQNAYITGRLEQLRDPVVLKLRPFWKYIAIDDGRCPTGICPACNGTILKPDAPWWASHTPLMHHRCRCRIDSLRLETAEKEGGPSLWPPEQEPPTGWGKPPDLTDPADLKKVVMERVKKEAPPKLVKDFQAKQDDAEARAIAARTAKEQMLIDAAKVMLNLPQAPAKMFTPPGVRENVKHLEERSERNANVLTKEQRDGLLGFSLGYDYEIRALQRGVPAEELIASRIALTKNDPVPVSRAEAEAHVAQAKVFVGSIATIEPERIPYKMYRGMSASSVKLAELLTHDDVHNVGMHTSSSAKPITASGFADKNMGAQDYRGDKLEHRVLFVYAEGTRAIPMACDRLSEFTMEAEGLLPDDARYKITKREVHSEPGLVTYVFHLTEIAK